MTELTDRGTVRILLDAIQQSFQGRFEILPKTDESVGTISVWFQLLKDLPSKCVLAGGYQVLSEVRHPPSPGEVRQAALDIADGALAPPSPWIAWERVVEAVKAGGSACDALTIEECRALKMIGGAWTLRNSDTISYDRRQFCEAYSEIMRARRKTAGAIPEVRQVAEGHAPAQLPAPAANENQLPAPIRRPSPEQLKELLKGYVGNQNREIEIHDCAAGARDCGNRDEPEEGAETTLGSADEIGK